MTVKELRYKYMIMRIGGNYVKDSKGKSKRMPVLYYIPFGKGKKNYLVADDAKKLVNTSCKVRKDELDVYYVVTHTQKKVTTFEITPKRDGSETAVFVFRKKDRRAVRKMINELAYKYPYDDLYDSRVRG